MPFLLAIYPLLLSQDPPTDLSRYVYPLAKARRSPRIRLDYAQVPDQKAWMEQAGKLARDWYPQMTRLLATQKWNAPKQVTFIVKPDLEVPAYAAGDTITINGKWIKSHPDDFGVVIHELTHVIQSYPDFEAKPGWLVEGIADYIRWWRYEPDAPRPRINKKTASYRDAYRTTAYFLGWVTHRYHAGLVPALDFDMREKRDPMPEFERLTGKTADVLWQEFIASLE